MLSVAAIEVDGTENSEGEITVHVGTFIEMKEVEINYGKQTKKVILTPESEYYSGKEVVTVSANTIIEVFETDTYNGTKVGVKEGDKDVYLWITNYKKTDNKLSDGNNGIQLGSDQQATVVGIGMDKIALTGNIIIGGEPIVISKYIINSDIKARILAVVNTGIGAVSQTGNVIELLLWSADVDNCFLESINSKNPNVISIFDSNIGNNFLSGNNDGKNIKVIIHGENVYGNGFLEPATNKKQNKYLSMITINLVVEDSDYKKFIDRCVVNKIDRKSGVAVTEINFIGDIHDYSSASTIKNHPKYFSTKLIFDKVTSIGNYAFSTYNGQWELSQESTFNSLNIGIGAFQKAKFKEVNSDLLIQNCSIGERAFEGTDITSLTLSNIRSIGSAAFSDCVYLSSITLDNNLAKSDDLVTIFANAGSGASTVTLNATGCNFGWIPGTFIKVTKEEQTIDNNQQTIFYYADESKNEIILVGAEGESININKTNDGRKINVVASSAFRGNSSIQNVSITEAKIGNYAFKESLLKTIQIQDCTSLGVEVFMGCSSLTEADIKGSYQSIPEKAFSGCNKLNRLIIGPSVTTIGAEAFNNCNALSSLSLPESLSIISKDSFSYCKDLKSIDLSKTTVKVIPEQAFMKCSSLRTVYLPSGIESIGTSAFAQCTSLSEINLSSTELTTIGNSAFHNAKSLSLVEIPVTLTTLGAKSFAGTGLTKIDLSGCTQLSSIGEGIFATCLDLTYVKLCSSSTIGGNGDTSGVFQNCTSLETIEIGNSISKDGNLNLEDETKSNIFEIGKLSFSYTKFKSLNITSDNDLAIGESAFMGMDSLESVTIDAKNVTIGQNAFAFCKNLRTLNINATSVILGIGAFDYCSSLGVDEGGNGVAVNLSSVTKVGKNAFHNCISLSHVVFSDKLIELNVESFTNCSSLTKIEIPTTERFKVENGLVLDGTGKKLILAPTGLTSVKIPSTVEEISTYMCKFTTLQGDTPESSTTVLSLLNNAHEFLTDDNKNWQSIDGCLIDKTGNVIVPLNKTEITLDARGQSSITLNNLALINTQVQKLTIITENITINSYALINDNLRELQVESSGTVMFAAQVGNLDSFSVVASRDVKIEGSTILSEAVSINSQSHVTITGSVIDAKSISIFSNDLDISAANLNRGLNLTQLELVANNKLTTDDSSLAGNYILKGSATIGFKTILGKIDKNDGVEYYIGGKLDGFNNVKSFVLADGIIAKQVCSSPTVYAISELDITSYNVNGSKLTFIESDGRQHWDIRVYIYNDGKWSDEESKWESGYYVSEGTILKIEPLEATSDDTYVKVSFDTGCTMNIPDLWVVKDRSILSTQMPTLTRAGYEFKGWFTDSEYSRLYVQSQITENTKLYAKWDSLGNYVDLIGVGGSFSIPSGIFGDSGTIKSGTKIEFTVKPGFEFLGFTISPADMVEWTEDKNTITITKVEGYVSIRSDVKYASSSSDLTSIIDIETVSSDENLILNWAYSNNPIMAGMSWKNTPGTPLIVDNYVYLHLGSKIYKLDSADGRELASSESADTGDFYNYVGFGGDENGWFIIDYATGKILDENLQPLKTNGGKEVKLPSGMKYVKWYNGYFYTSFGGSLYKIHPSITDNDGVMTNLYNNPATDVRDIFSQYGTTSSAIIENGIMYWLSTEGKKRFICSANLSDQTTHEVELSDIEGYFMDDGWLTYYNGYIYTTGYVKGLFGDIAADGNSKIVWIKADFTNSDKPNYVNVENDKEYDKDGKLSPKARNSLLSNFVIVEGRGYLNASMSATEGGYMMVYNIIENGKPEFVTEVKSDASHGGIVVSTANLDARSNILSGYVNIYMMNYSGSNYLYVFTDRVENGTWTFDTKIEKKELNPGFGSQAIRVDSEGRIIFYNDSGALYCYVPAHMYRDYYFMIESDNGFEVVKGQGEDGDPYMAISKALMNAKGFKTEINDIGGNVQVTFGNNKLFAYYCYEDADGNAVFDSISRCSNLSTLRCIYLLKNETAGDISIDQPIYISESGESGKKTESSPIIYDGVTVDTLTMKVGDQIKLESKDGVKWSTDNSTVVRIDSNGYLTAVSLGYARIIAEIGSDKSVCLISVADSTLVKTYGQMKDCVGLGMTKYKTYTVSFDLNGGNGHVPDSQSFEVGSTVKLPDKVERSGYTFMGWWDGSSLYAENAEYVVSETVVLKPYWIDSSEKKITTITIVDSDGKSYNDMKIGMSVGDKPLELTVAVLPSTSTVAVTWESSNPNVVSVSNGVIEPVMPGTATVKVKAINGSAESSFTVVVADYELVIDKATIDLAIGDTTAIKAEYKGDLSGSKIKWTSDNLRVAIVDESGKVIAKGQGTAVITATAPNGVTAECLITVSVKIVDVSSVSLSPSSITLKIGGVQALKATVKPSDATDAKITWTSSNPSVVSVTSNGVVTAISKGIAIITATSADGKQQDSCTVTVEGTVTAISLDQNSLRLESGKNITLKASTSPDESTKFTWTTSDSKVATVSSGKVTGVSPGTATITVKYGNLTATCLVTVYKNSDVKTDTKDNGDGTTTVKTEETISSGSSDVKKVTVETKDKEDKSMGSETKVDAQSKDGKVKTEATVKKDSSGNITESTVTTTITAESKSSNGRQTFTVSEDVLLSALDQIAAVKDATGDDADPVILIDTGSKGTASESQATLPSEALSIMAKNKDAQLQVRTSAGTIEISSGVMSKLSSDGKDVKLGISKISENEISAETKGKIGDAYMFELSASSGDTQHHTLGGKVVVSLPYALNSGKNGNDVRVYHMDDTGKLVLMLCTYDAESGSVSFETDHFSYFVVSDRALLEEAGAVTQSDSGLEGLLTIVIALLVVLIVMIAAAFVLYIRNNNIHL